MSEVLSIEELMRMAARAEVDLGSSDEPRATRALVAGISLEKWFITEDADSGMASFVEAVTGRPSAALCFRRSLLGPFAAIGGGSFAWATEGEVQNGFSLTLDDVDHYDSEYRSLAQSLRTAAAASGIRVLSRDALSAPVPQAIASRVNSSLMSIEGRVVVTLYDVIFQWQD